MLTGIGSLLIKDITLEWRHKFAFNGVLLYLLSTVFVVYLAFEGVIDNNTWNALFWIIMLFASMNATLKSFLQEKEGRQLYYYSLVSPECIILSKIFYNALLMMLLGIAGLVVFVTILGNPVVSSGLFVLNMLLGIIALASVLSMVSAIASRAQNNFTLMAILSFPLVLPLLLVIIKNSAYAMQGSSFDIQMPGLVVILLLMAITVILSVILFPYIWKE